mmetsp:Transcript_17187/g.27874  ORF Transcript_17187/g.27874 Transcript_17187/m.27874 type:complete len:148 (-) Transcript_17187:435-878(-)
MAPSQNLPSFINDMDRSRSIHFPRFLPCSDWFIRPILLFVQFGAKLYSQRQKGLLTMDSKMVFLGVALFCLSSISYRRFFCKTFQVLVLTFVPEVFTNIVLATVIFVRLEIAFDTMNVLTEVMAILSGVGSIQTYRRNRKSNHLYVC